MADLPKTVGVSFKEKKFVFYASRTAVELTRGLAGIESLSDEYVDGMLFDFGVDHSAIMTPRGLKFPVEVAFLDSMGVIKEIKTLDPQFGHNLFAAEPVRYALEVPVGFFQANEIQVGARLDV